MGCFISMVAFQGGYIKGFCHNRLFQHTCIIARPTTYKKSQQYTLKASDLWAKAFYKLICPYVGNSISKFQEKKVNVEKLIFFNGFER